MNNFSLIEKFQVLMDMIVASPLFFVCAVVCVFFLILLIMNVALNKKINKILFVISSCFIIITLIVLYNKVIFKMLDNFFDNVFMALYFPNIAIYITILIISNTFLIISIFKKKLSKISRIINIICALILNFFLVLVMDTVNKNNIDIYNSLEIYKNSNLLVLLELSTAIFTSWILLSLVVRASNKLKKYDNIKIKPKVELIFDD